MRLLILASTASLAAAVHKSTRPPFFASASCDASIPGTWGGQFPPSPPIGDSYSLAWDPSRGPGAWRATADGSVGWGVALGQLAADNSTVTMYTADSASPCWLRAVTTGGRVVSLTAGACGSSDGPALPGTVNRVNGLALSADGATLLIADTYGFKVRLLRGGVLSSLAGSAIAAFSDGVGDHRLLPLPHGRRVRPCGREHCNGGQGQPPAAHGDARGRGDDAERRRLGGRSGRPGHRSPLQHAQWGRL